MSERVHADNRGAITARTKPAEREGNIGDSKNKHEFIYFLKCLMNGCMDDKKLAKQIHNFTIISCQPAIYRFSVL